VGQLGRGGAPREAKRGSLIFLPGDPSDELYVIKSGVVKLSAMALDGRAITLDFRHRDDVFGEVPLLGSSPRAEAAEVHEDARIAAVSKSELGELFGRYPELGLRMMQLNELRLRRLQQRVTSLLFKNARARVAQSLLDLSEEHGIADARGILLTLRLGQEELGSYVGLSRESVNVCLTDFRREGLVDLQGRALRLLAPERIGGIGGLAPAECSSWRGLHFPSFRSAP
jgi:CRP/FNR family transcriptional regulator